MASWIGQAVFGVGGRKWCYALLGLVVSGVLLLLGKIDAAQWVSFNQVLAGSFMGATALEGAAENWGKGKGGG